MRRKRVLKTGKILAPLDLLIATHALSVDAVLVTNDQSFRLVDDLKVEDWTEEAVEMRSNVAARRYKLLEG